MTVMKYIMSSIGGIILINLVHNLKELGILILGIFFVGYAFWERDKMTLDDKPTPAQRQEIREFFALVSDNLSDEDCDNIWIYGCSKPDAEMIERHKKAIA